MIYALYLSSLIVSATVAGVVAYYLWRRRSKPGATVAVWMMLAVVVLSLGYVLQFTSATLSGQIFATNIQYFSIATLPIMWFVFSLRYTGHDDWLTRRKLFFLGIIPLATIVLAWTNGIDGLMWYGRHLVTSGPFTIIDKTYGPWFWIHASYSSLLLLSGMFFLLQRLMRPPRLYREQSIALLICVTVPFVFSVLYVFHLTPYRIDLTPPAFVISGLAVAWGLLRVRLFDIVPMARDVAMESMSDGVIVLDAQKRAVDINLAAQHIIGHSASEVIGQPVAQVLANQPNLLELCHSIAETQTEIFLSEDETQPFYNVSILPLNSSRGFLCGYIVTIRDITERKRVEVEKREMEQKAQTASRLAFIGEMAAGIAHEINNPLTSVIGYAQLLMQEDIPKNIREEVKIIHDGAQRVANIVKRLLSFARQQTQKQEYIDINEIVKSTIPLRAYGMETNNIVVTTHLDTKLPRTMADSEQLKQVFLNIVINAETEMRIAHGRGDLSINTEVVGNIIRISFKDDGPGITKENMTKLFDPFFTTREVGEGTGLGLSVCHGIIADHDGRLYARSQLGKGATFVVELSIVPEEKQPELDESVAEQSKNAIWAKAKILVVDDEITILKFLSQFLTDEGYQVETVNNAYSALERIKDKRYNLILLDIRMPGISGPQFYQSLQEFAQSLARRVVFITGDVMGTDTKNFLLKTKAPCISKPFDTEKLKKDINRILEERI